MNDNQELHVIFGAGPLGKWTARELVALGKRVRMINRSGQVADVPAAVEAVKGDAYDAALNTELTQGAATIYQCAQPEYHQWPGNFPRMQAAILAAASANGARLIAAENLYMYGDPNGQPLTEEMPYHAHTVKGKVRQEMTETLFAAHAAGKVRAAAVRGSDFFGPDDPIYGRLIFGPALAGGKVNLMGKADQPHTFTYTADFGKALAIVGTHDEALGQAWHVPSAPAVTQAEFARAIGEELGQPVKTQLGSPFIIRMMGLFNPTLREMNEMMYEFTKPFVLDSSKFERTFGMTATPFRQQLRDTLAWVKAHPEVLVEH